MEEIWAEVEGYPDYSVSNTGKVFSKISDRYLAYRLSDGGYPRVVLTADGVRKDWYVHHLVARAFFAKPYKNGVHIRHVNGNKKNNHVGNLTIRRRIKDVELEMARPKKRKWGRRVRVIETDEIFRTVRECADAIGGDYSSIYACLRGDQQKHKGLTYEYCFRLEE